MKDFFGRSPFVLLGALGLLSLPGGLIEWQKDIAFFIDGFAWASDLFWWPWNWLTDWLFGLRLHPWWQTYLTMGIIVSGAFLRGIIANETEHDDESNFLNAYILIGVTYTLLWPFVFLILLMFTWPKPKTDRQKEIVEANKNVAPVFSETFIVALLILALNYALL